MSYLNFVCNIEPSQITPSVNRNFLSCLLFPQEATPSNGPPSNKDSSKSTGLKTLLKRTPAPQGSTTPWGVVLKPVPRTSSAPLPQESTKSTTLQSEESTKKTSHSRIGKSSTRTSTVKTATSSTVKEQAVLTKEPSLLSPVSGSGPPLPATKASSDLLQQAASSDLASSPPAPRIDLSEVARGSSPDLSKLTRVTSPNPTKVPIPVTPVTSLSQEPRSTTKKSVWAKGAVSEQSTAKVKKSREICMYSYIEPKT
jgi:hypothetical protein